MTIDKTIENRRIKKMAVELVLAAGGSPDEADAYAKGEASGFSRCNANLTDATPDLVKQHFATISEVDMVERSNASSIVHVVSIALQLSPHAYAHTLGFLDGIKRWLAETIEETVRLTHPHM